MSKRDANIRQTPNNRVTSGPGMVNSLDEDSQAPRAHSVNANTEEFNPRVAGIVAEQAAYNGFDKIENESGLTQLDSEEGALVALRAYAMPGVFDIDKLIVAAAAYKFHTQK